MPARVFGRPFDSAHLRRVEAATSTQTRNCVWCHAQSGTRLDPSPV